MNTKRTIFVFKKLKSKEMGPTDPTTSLFTTTTNETSGTSGFN